MTLRQPDPGCAVSAAMATDRGVLDGGGLHDARFGRRPLGRAALRALATLMVIGVPCRHALATGEGQQNRPLGQTIPGQTVPGRAGGGGCSLSTDEAEDVLGSGETRNLWAITDDVPQIMPSSGDQRLDTAFGHMLADLAGKFDERPGFGFFDDTGAPNAYATNQTYMPNTRGTVLMGQTFMNSFLRQSQFGDILVMAVCAHEFGHIKQYFHENGRGYDRLMGMHSTVKYVELHADFLAGFYVGMRANGYSEEQLVTLGRGWEASGDTAFHDPGHHGTHAERIAAIETGYRMAINARPGITDAFAAGLHYLRA